MFAVAVGCGKKGPPMAPLVRVPAAVETIEARRVGHDVYITFTIPSENVDEFTPADIGRVEVYGYTGPTPPPRARWGELGTLIASVPVVPYPGAERAQAETATPPDAPAQGAEVTIRDTLTSEEPALRRFYAAFPLSPRGRAGPPGEVADLPLTPLLPPPPQVETTYSESAVRVSWVPSGGLIAFLLERPAEPVRYNVYRTLAPDPAEPAVAEQRWRARPPEPLNAQPLDTLTFSDTIEFDRERCYTVRAVRGRGAAASIGEASPPACATPVDIFAPAPPRSLAAVAAEGAISLIWEPNGEADLGGYLVLRAEAPGATLLPLTPAPIPEARYRDADVRPGTRYVYAVVAVDRRLPVPNVSGESERVEETAR